VSTVDKEVGIPGKAGDLLEGRLHLPDGAQGIVVFAHGSGSGRYSPRNRMVARALQQRGLATLLMDLLTEEEEETERFTRHLRFDIPMLAERVVKALQWLRVQSETRALAVGLFGSSTGAAAALVAAARVPERVQAIVSRGGRPDLAADHLLFVSAPTLLVVGGADPDVLELNRTALRQLSCEKQLVVIPVATHLFEEPGALEEVTQLATGWFLQYIGAREGRFAA
jgi:putative phosphoribosyl transferase